MSCQWRLRKLGKDKHHKAISKQRDVIKSNNCPVYEDVITPNLIPMDPINIETNIAYGPITH